jgi:hypothetical protein
MPITAGPVAQLLRSLTAFLRPALPRPAQVLLVVEGPNDIEFLRRISAIQHRDDRRLPDLTDMERHSHWSSHPPAASICRPPSALPASACPSFIC